MAFGQISIQECVFPLWVNIESCGHRRGTARKFATFRARGKGIPPCGLLCFEFRSISFLISVKLESPQDEQELRAGIGRLAFIAYRARSAA